MRLPIARYALREVVLMTLFLSGGLVFSLWRVFWLSPVFLFPLIFLLWFFRDPERKILKSRERLLSPADGRVVEISSVKEQEFLKEEATRISIFMSILDVHVNRMPCSGRVEFLSHRDGHFFDARSKEASIQNECYLIGLVMEEGRRLFMKQIAGLVARRIVCPLSLGEHLEQGERFGMVKFGSRVELYIPLAFRIRVKEGQKVKAGITVLAETKLVAEGERS